MSIAPAICASVSLAAIGFAQQVQGALLVHEGFNYDPTNKAMNATAATGTGLAGNYTVDTGTGTANYNAAGNLTFGSNFSSGSGGALSLSAGATINRVLGVAIDSSATLASGTLWEVIWLSSALQAEAPAAS